MKLGTTFSHRQLQHLSCPVLKALDKAIELNFDHLRICTYWNEIETTVGKYDWSWLEKILNVCQQKQQDVVLTLGVKAPRYPEFYFPDWIESKDLHNHQTQKKILNFIEKTIKKFASLSCIKYYQIENEALDPSGPEGLTIPLTFLTKEISLIKKLDHKKVITSLWANKLSKRNLLPQLTAISDVVGLDLYYQQFMVKILGRSIYVGPQDNQRQLTEALLGCNQETWIMELQAEPWEASEQDYLAPNPQSISPEKIRSAYKKISQLPVSTILFWGFEYWFYQLNKNNNDSYFATIADIITASNHHE